jgi:hypothetical protein
LAFVVVSTVFGQLAKAVVEDDVGSNVRLSGGQRAVRLLMGLAIGAFIWPVALLSGTVSVVITLSLAWFSVSFITASVIGYAGCPEVGALWSAFSSAHLATH